MKYKIYQEVLVTRTVIVEDMEKDDWEGLDEAADQTSKEDWSVQNEDVKEQQYWDENHHWFKENENDTT